MPALAKPPVVLPRFVPHRSDEMTAGPRAGAALFSRPESENAPHPEGSERLESSESSKSSENMDRLAHDARNILSTLMLYCDLLAEPGVLGKGHAHYAGELCGIARTANQILEKMASGTAAQPQALPVTANHSMPAVFVTDMAEEVARLQPLLVAMAGPAVQLSVATMPCPGRTALAVEDLTRILINLVRNASDAMPGGGRVRVTAQYGDGHSFLNGSEIVPARSVTVAVTDNGPGIPEALREQIFDTGFTTRGNKAGWPSPPRRGLGLNIVRNLVEAAGGTVRVMGAPVRGARFEVTLPLIDATRGPVTSGTCVAPQINTFTADHA